MPIILLTRPEHSAEPMKSALTALGWTVLLQPTIEIRPPESWSETDQTIRQWLEQRHFDWLVFSSGNGVRYFFDRLQRFDERLSCLQSIRIAAVGSGTDDALEQRIGCRADLLPERFAAEGVAEKLIEEASGKRFLLLRANRGRDVLRRQLEESGGIVTEIAVYQSVDVETPLPEIAELMRQGKINYVTATSSSIARSMVRMFGEDLRRTEIVSISPITSQTLRDLGFPPQHEAETASMDGIIDVCSELAALPCNAIFG